VVGDRGKRARHRRVDLVHMREQIAPGGGRVRPPADTLDQPHTEPALQLLDLRSTGDTATLDPPRPREYPVKSALPVATSRLAPPGFRVIMVASW